VLIGVDGELDLTTLPALAAELERSLSRPAGHLIVCLTRTVFCGIRGATLLVDTAGRAAQLGIGYSISGAPAQVRRLWSAMWAPAHQPAQFATTERALVDALARLAARDQPVGAVHHRRS
jgi:hypothetical protein